MTHEAPDLPPFCLEVSMKIEGSSNDIDQSLFSDGEFERACLIVEPMATALTG